MIVGPVLALASAVGRPLWPAGGRILEILLASIGRSIEEAVCISHAFDAARISRIRMKNIRLQAEENTQPVTLAFHGVGTVPCLQLGFAAIVIFDGCDLLIERDVKVVVEIVAERREPRQAPALL